MLFNEFQELMGREVTQNEYDFANRVYMNTDLDKKFFVEEWKQQPSPSIINDLLIKAEFYYDQFLSLRVKNFYLFNSVFRMKRELVRLETRIAGNYELEYFPCNKAGLLLPGYCKTTGNLDSLLSDINTWKKIFGVKYVCILFDGMPVIEEL